jgi:hydrogenase expression/formation protein HypD
MKHLEEYRKKELVLRIAGRIRKRSSVPARFMEVCGGHTMTLHKYGLPALLPPTITLISGPGCPVCVSGQSFIGALLDLCSEPSLILTTYGDLLRIPSGNRSLESERAKGADIRIVYSVMESLALAGSNPGKKVVFAGIGFETTAPLTAAAILRAKADGLKNFFVYSSHKTMPPALDRIASGPGKITGFIAPGHVTAVTGLSIYDDLVKKYQVGVVVSGFEPVDLMLAIAMLTEQSENGKFLVENAYPRVVRPGGNLKAQETMAEVFEGADDHWRGLGMIPGSGLKIRQRYRDFDAGAVFGIKEHLYSEPAGCICGKVITGESLPSQCRHFGRSCTPETPVGACMVSTEGTCSVWFRYKNIQPL